MEKRGFKIQIVAQIPGTFTALPKGFEAVKDLPLEAREPVQGELGRRVFKDRDAIVFRATICQEIRKCRPKFFDELCRDPRGRRLLTDFELLVVPFECYKLVLPNGL